MSKPLEYTTRAYRYTARYPFLTYAGTQVNFWIIANVVIIIIINFYNKIVSEEFQVSAGDRFGTMLLAAVVFGVLYGLSLGAIGYYLEQRMFKRVALGKIIVIKTISSLALLIIMLVLLRYVFFRWFMEAPRGLSENLSSETIWRNVFYMLITYYFFMTLLINFINQINKKYGPGMLLPLLLGRYRTPKEEERIFMFMDLKSSTTIAEKLGHLKYSAFIRDCFADINEVLYPYRAQVYQYVGDEVVVMWPAEEGLDGHRCICFYAACQKQFQTKREYYQSNYGILPEFKAGAHVGIVTAVEIGEIKRDIAYHGDTLNTAARIQSVCNEYGKNFLISEVLLNRMTTDPHLHAERLGMMKLRGKTEEVGVVSVEWLSFV